MADKKSLPLWQIVLTWILRVGCGGLFIFSGFVKAIDPWGTIFKVEDYLGVMDFGIGFPLIRLFVFGLCAVEFIIGCFLLIGAYRKTCPWFAALIMCFMLPFSFWVALDNPVPDCGCFGDAWVISNWATFIKNIVLSAGIVWLIFRNVKAVCLISPAFQWLGVVASGVFILIIELLGYYYQPLIDFRDYKVGTSLFASSSGNEEEPDYKFIYEKNGERKEFDIDSVPEESEGWNFVERVVVPSVSENNAAEKEKLHVFDIEDDTDLTDELSENSGNELIVMIPDAAKISPSTTWKLNSLYEWSKDNDVRMIGIISGNKEEIEEWEDLSMASYPLYLADDSQIKEVVRGNPGIVFLHDGIILWKTSLSAIDVEEFTARTDKGLNYNVMADNNRLLLNCVFFYLIFMAFLIFISFTPRMANLLIKGGFASKKGVRHH